ncbi:hypothetical protein QFZ91_005736 [Paraburkholderia sp. JPY419]
MSGSNIGSIILRRLFRAWTPGCHSFVVSLLVPDNDMVRERALAPEAEMISLLVTGYAASRAC